jgi:hypothetical protein
MLKHILLLFLLPVFLFAQDLITDRPDYTESAAIVPLKTFQLESGFQYSKAGDLTENSLPNLLIRYGLTKHFELRFGGAGWSRFNNDGTSNTYRNDALVETKILLTKESAPADVAVILASTIPVGDDEVSAGDAQYGFKLAGGWDVTPTLGFGFNIGAILAQQGNERPVVTILSAAFGKSLTDQVGAFFEFYAQAPEDATWSPVFDTGLTFLVAPKTQFDAYLGLGLNGTAPDVIIGVGFSQLF